MLLQEKIGHVDKQGELKTSSFGIANSRKAFEILSSGIYSDKITAIIRELSTNAADSHTEAKQTKPFEVHLPNMLEPYFSVRDYGTGMDEVKVFALYTTYFASDRNRSNAFTGCLGLGSKSPFAYTDQFTVESRNGGFKRTYSCYISDSGTPTVTKLSEVKSDDPSGLEVQVAVKAADFGAFSTKAVNVLSWFNPRPTVGGGRTFSFFTQQYMRRQPTYGLHDRAGGPSRVVMGNVAYPIDIAQTLPDIYNNPLGNFLRHGVDLFLPIGSVDIAASRETLGYTKATVATLNKETNAALDDMRVYCQTMIDSAKSIWEARRLIYKFAGGIMSDYIPKKPVWNNIPVSREVIQSGFKCAPIEFELLHTANKSLRHSCTGEIYADDKPIIINDLKVGTYSRTDSWMRANGHHTAYLITEELADDQPSDTRPLFKTASGVYEVAIKASSLPKPPSRPRGGPGAKDRTTLLEWTNSSNSSRHQAWNAVDKDLKDGGVFITTMRYYGLENNREYSVSELHAILNAMAVLGYKVDKLYGIRPHDRPRLDKYKTKWMNLIDFVNDALTTHKVLVSDIAMIRQLTTSEEHWATAIESRRSGLEKSPNFKPYFEMLDKIKSIKATAKVAAYRHLYAAMHPGVELGQSDKLTKLREAAIKPYPLFARVPAELKHADMASAYVRYVKALDAYKGS